MAAFGPSTEIARLASGLFGLQIGNTTMQWALDAVNGNAYGSVAALANSLYQNNFSGMTNAAVASLVVANVGITTAAQVAEATTVVTNALNAAAAGTKGATILGILNSFATLSAAPYASAVAAFNNQIALAETYAKTTGTKDVALSALTPVFNLDSSSSIANLPAMRLTGNQDVRIDFSNPANQIKGLDVDGDGVIESDGIENRITGVAANFKAVDAYPRNPWNQNDTANNFTGDIFFDGTGFKGDGVSSNGNVFLGGFGNDIAQGGDGNDFLAGGGTMQGRSGVDTLTGGRNADFFFAELSLLDPTDGNRVSIDGGVTADDNSAGVTQSAQDADWLLLEVSDDDEPVTVVLRDDSVFDPTFSAPNADGVTGGIYTAEANAGTAGTVIDRTGYVITRAGAAVGTLRDVENFDASGNLYGFLNGLDVEIGGRATDDRDEAGSSNYGIGSSAQLRVVGSNVANIIIGGYDNDYIQGADGNDLLMGGNLKQFLETVTGGVTNVNLSGIVNDGRDELFGGAGNDNIVFEADGGTVSGDAQGERIDSAGGTGGNDTLWLTKYSTGTQTAADLTTDGVLRFDLTATIGSIEGTANEGGTGYGGANTNAAIGAGAPESSRSLTADQSNYKTTAAPSFSPRVDVDGMENIDATGLGAIDYYAAGANRPESVFANHQNFAGYNGNLNLRGTQGANQLYSGEGDDVIEGRAGNDDLEGNKGKDDFYFAIDGDFAVGGGATGDGVDVIRRKIDADGDGFWDQSPASTNTQNPSNGANVWGQDFGLDSDSTTGASVLTIDIQKSGGNAAGTELNQVVNFVSEIVTGVKVGSAFETITLNTAAIKAATTYTALTAAINAALDATSFGADLQATLSSNGHTITISDAKGRELADQTSEVAGAGVSLNQIANTATQNTFVFGAPAVTTVQDRLIYKAYEDRSDNEGVDDDSVLGSTISLGADAYAQDLVISFQKDATSTFGTGTTTYLAEDQSYTLTFDNLTTQDRVTVTVNGVKYTLQVGVALDGTIQANEDVFTGGVNQATVQSNFLTRLADFITNSFTDDDTNAGKVDATATATTLVLTQRDYTTTGEETVFMRTPSASIDQLSGGQTATWTVANNAQHEVQLYQFDGRNNKLNTENVKFWGQEEIQRSVLATAKTAGGTLTGLDAVLIDGGVDNLQASVTNTAQLIDAAQAAIFNNVATNANLSTNFAVHGDDFLLGGDGVDVIKGGTGDDRIHGSVGSATAPTTTGTEGERLDGGKNYYAVKLLDEAQARVYVLNKWEAANLTTAVPDLATKVVSSITLIDETETGATPVVGSGVFNDTLQYQQEDFGDGKSARFTITLDDYAFAGGVVSLRNDGAGLVSIDANGDGVFESYARFTNFENIRTVSGWGAANASEGQGNDTLNVSALSKDTGGVSYDLTSDATAGQVKYSADAHNQGAAAAGASAASLALGALRPQAGDFESLIIAVDGVESVIAGEGDDLLLIDETEAAKNNSFTAGLGDDRIQYTNDFGGGGLVADRAEPMVTINVNTAADTDTVEMTGGRLGTVKATDTLSSVEFITIAGNTAEGTSEADTLNVANVVGATVDYNDTVRSSATTGTGIANSGTVRSAAGTVEVTIEDLFEVERVIGSTGNDTVKVADAAVMRLNARDDTTDATAAEKILFMTYRDFDDLNAAATTRKSFAAQVADNTINTVINQGEFTFNLSAEGGVADVDRLDYSAELGRIIVPVGQGTATAPQYVVVDGDNDQDFTDAESRVDALYRVEEIVAAQGRSVMDFTAVGQARQITFQYTAPSSNPADKAVLLQTIRIADGNGNTISGLNAFIEKYTYDSPTSLLAAVPDATWNQIEGSDAAEVVIYQGSEDLVNQAGIDHRYTTDTLTLRGGANEVRYSPLETSISLSLNVVEENTATTNASEGLITGTVTFQDGKGINAPSGTFLGGTHTITSHTSDNSTATGNLKIEGSQDAEDVVSFTTVSNKTYILGTSPGVVNVNIGALSSIVLTGFEFLQDSTTNDVYDIRSISSTAGLRLTDNDDDHDAIRVANDSVNYNGSGVNTIDLDNISAAVGGFNFDFDVLDLTNLTSAVSGLTVNGGTDAAPVETDPGEVADNTDEVVLGALARVSTIADFETMVLTEASVAAGATFTFNPAANTLVQGSTTVTTSADVLSFGGLVREANFSTSAFGTSYVAAATTGVTINLAGATGGEVYGGAGADTINGGNAADTIRGGAGNDTLTGGVGTEVRTVQIVGVMDGAGGNTVTLTFDGDGAGPGTFAVTVTEGVEIAAGAGNAAVADALAAKVTANLTALNAGALWNNGATLQSVSSAGGILTFTFSPGVDVTGTIVTAETDAGATFAISAETVVTNGGNGGADTFTFESTAAKNGADTINNVTVGVGGDVFNFAQFFGAASALADLNGAGAGFAADFVAAGGALANGQVGIVFNKSSLTASDVQLAAAAGKISLVDNGKAVVLVTADADGVSDTTVNSPYLVYYVQDTNTAVGAQTYTATLVGTVNSAAELNAADWAAANIG